ncbi:MAG: hypothetical protein ABI405_03115 [Parafilimonas sp.]
MYKNIAVTFRKLNIEIIDYFSPMEPEVREFFRRISLSIGLFIVWVMVNVIIGVKLGYAFFEDKIDWGNIVFYIWVIGSLAALIWGCMQIWKKPIEHLDD